MKNNIPHVFANPFDKKINNQKEIYYGKSENLERQNPIVRNKDINKIFSSPNYIYKKKVLITTNNGAQEKIIIGRTNNYLLTNNNEKIYINDILNIQEV